MASELASFYNRTRAARKIIVVDLGFLGDTVHLVPALWELKAGYPEARLHVLTSPVGEQVLRLARCVDRAWGMDLHGAKGPAGSPWQVLRALRREGFDVAFNFSGSDRTIFMTALSGARQRVAYHGGRWHFYNRWLIGHWVPRQAPDRLVYEKRRQVLAACGMSLGPARFNLTLDPGLVSWAASLVPVEAIHISVNSAKPTREWPLEHHATLLRLVWAEHPELQVLVSGSAKSREQQRLQTLRGLVNDPRLLLLPDSLSIPQLAAVLARCCLHVGPDSGVLHLAVALHIPTVSFFRQQGDYKEFMPVGARHKVISMPCHCIDGHNAPCERLGQAECFAQIPPERVAALIAEQLAATRTGNKPI